MDRLSLINAPSPNHDERRQPLDMLVLHYTGMETGQAALERLCDPEAKVSSHYLVEEDGRVFQLVDEERRAWHAGVAQWNGKEDINSRSIGIEIVNGGHEYGLPPFPEVQIEAVLRLCLDLLSRHAISAHNIVGHSDIAPLRKLDPGERFPWERLAQDGVGLWPMTGSQDLSTQTPDASVAAELLNIGYGFEPEVPGALNAVTRAFQQRWRSSSANGVLDEETTSLIIQISDLFTASRVSSEGAV